MIAAAIGDGGLARGGETGERERLSLLSGGWSGERERSRCCAGDDGEGRAKDEGEWRPPAVRCCRNVRRSVGGGEEAGGDQERLI